MKKLFLLLILNSLAYSMEEGTELQTISVAEENEFDSADESENSSQLPEHSAKEKKSKSCCWSFTKKLLIGSLLASQGVGLATDIIGMQESQQVNALVSPVVAYNEYHAPHNPNCTYDYWMGYLDPLPSYMRDEGCTQGHNQQVSCVFETCPGGQKYISDFTTMYASQITAMATRALAIIGLLAGIWDCAWNIQAGGCTFR